MKNFFYWQYWILLIMLRCLFLINTRQPQFQLISKTGKPISAQNTTELGKLWVSLSTWNGSTSSRHISETVSFERQINYRETAFANRCVILSSNSEFHVVEKRTINYYRKPNVLIVWQTIIRLYLKSKKKSLAWYLAWITSKIFITKHVPLFDIWIDIMYTSYFENKLSTIDDSVELTEFT